MNLRPVRLFEGVPSPLANRKPGDIDFWVVRENTEGEYSQLGGRMFQGTENEFAVQEAVFTRKGVDRVLKFAFEFARTTKKKHVTSATKSNGIIHTMPFWDERFAEMKKNYPEIRADQYHIDILTAHFVRNPDWFDVVVGSNLFGDILSDLGPALTGSIGVAPSGNINPERKFPSMFEPVHGSAPDIAGKGIANPIGQIWSGAMMVRHLGYPEAAEAIERAIAASLVEGGPRTRDLGGNGDTKTVGAAEGLPGIVVGARGGVSLDWARVGEAVIASANRETQARPLSEGMKNLNGRRSAGRRRPCIAYARSTSVIPVSIAVHQS